MKILKIVKRLGLFLAAYITYAVVLNLPIFDAQPTELAMSYQQGESLSAEHYRLIGLTYVDRDAEEVGREILERARLFERARLDEEFDLRPHNNDVLELLSTGESGKRIRQLDVSELVGIAASAENDVVFESAGWQELNRRLTSIDWEGLGKTTLDAESYRYFFMYGEYYDYLSLSLWQLVYIIRNQDEVALAEWLARYMSYIEYPGPFYYRKSVAQRPWYSSETMRELLDLEFLSTAGRSSVTAQLKTFIERIDRNRSAILMRVRENEARIAVGTLITGTRHLSVAGVWDGKYKTSDRAESTLVLALVVFFQRQRFINRAADYSDSQINGVIVTHRPIFSKILFPQDIVGELILDALWHVSSYVQSIHFDEADQFWNTYVDSLVELRAELAQLQ
ncbi:hypothetical protein [uncultured Umboniibacter sp.]|uniref:hypothetical protein n=1 Tax=uncultured Umboniibacter sp. TaxID=1798917 RepID=UPI0026084783|nr:hypothetical protein [uncultured Umboniibacter sp.]